MLTGLIGDKKTKRFEVATIYGPYGRIMLKVKHFYIYNWTFSYDFEDDFEKDEFITVKQLAEVIKLPVDSLVEILYKNFYGQTYNSNQYPTITFKKLEQAKEAKEWLESLLLMHTMARSE